MKPVEIVQTIYPRLPEIVDEASLAEIATLESKEREFVLSHRSQRHQYLKALYLKAILFLGYSRLKPIAIPRQLRIRIAEELGLPKDMANIRMINAGEKSRIIGQIREFIGLKPYSRKAREELTQWLQDGVAHKETDLLAIINPLIQEFRHRRIELPPFSIIINMADKALKAADRAIQKKVAGQIGHKQREQLDLLLEKSEVYSRLDYFKADVQAPCASQILAELIRLEEMHPYFEGASEIEGLSRRKMKAFAQVAFQYHASELRQLNPTSRYVILISFVHIRRSQLLDAAVDLFIRIWDNTCATSKSHANTLREAQAKIYEQREEVLEDLLIFICKSKSDQALLKKIRTYRTKEEYETLLKQVKKRVSWTESWLNKVQDHYSALRRFLPQWYKNMPLMATTTGSSLLRAIAFIKEHGKSGDTHLPSTGIPTRFLDKDWERRAIIREPYRNTITSVLKAPYELGVVNATVDALKTGTIAVLNANKYAPIMNHLLGKEYFLENYPHYLNKLQRTDKAFDFYQSVRKGLGEALDLYNGSYDRYKKQFKISKKGKLSYPRPPSKKTPKRIKNLIHLLQGYIPQATILDVLLDCQGLTGYLDAFRPIGGRRQNMNETERIMGLLGALYAYGCNSGPSQAAQAIGLLKQKILYIRRHYMGIKQLADAASVLVDAYMSTSVARRLGDPGIFMTDAMRFPTLPNSLTARHHFRYKGTRSILLYQHVTSSCICFFSQALLCSVYEAIHMLDGIIKHRTNLEPVINICDSHGKSDFVFGLAYLLNVHIWPRISGRQNLKLWKESEDKIYENINPAITGTIRWELIDHAWQDIIWILASIMEGVANPSLIAERLVSQPKHPVTLGISELGKAYRSLYLLNYGMDMSKRRTVIAYTSRRETWNKFGRNVHKAFEGLIKEKSQEGQNELFWFLTVVQNAIVLWNALALDQAIRQAKKDGFVIPDEDLERILPVMIEHINFIGHFHVDLNRKPIFKMAS